MNESGWGFLEAMDYESTSKVDYINCVPKRK